MRCIRCGVLYGVRAPFSLLIMTLRRFEMIALMLVSWVVLVAVSYKGALFILKKAGEL